VRKMVLVALAGACWLGGCAGNPQVAEGQRLVSEGEVDRGLSILATAAREHPTNADVVATYKTTKQVVIDGLLAQADAARVAGRYDEADALFGRAAAIDPASPYPPNGIAAVQRDRRNARLDKEALAAFNRGDFATAEKKASEVLAQSPSDRTARSVMEQVAAQRFTEEVMSPVLKAALARPISLEFRDAPLRSIFEVISRGYGINFVFDRDVRPDLRTTIFVRDANLDEVIRLILVTNQLDRKVVNENSLLIFPKTPQKQRQYDELVVRSFYLQNADAKQTAAMLRSLVKTRDLFIDEKLNLIVMKDTPEAVRLAEKLVASQDLVEPEVLLDVEVMEVTASRMQELGLQFPQKLYYGVPEAPTTGGGGTTDNTTLPFAPVVPITGGGFRVFIPNPAIVANLRATVGAGNLLANPRIRVKNREKAKVHIGQKVPVVTSTTSVNVGVSTSVSYLDVGLKLDVEPDIHLDNEVAIKVSLEVSNIIQQVVTNNTVAYQLGTREATTVLRAHDGETQVLAGLIQDEQTKTSNRIPGLGDLPGIGRLFSSDLDNTTKTEIVLLITPHIVRNLHPPLTVPEAYASGTDTDIGAAPLRTRATRSGTLEIAPSGGPGPAPAAALPARPSPPSARPGAAAPQFSLLLAAPSQARAGSEFSVRFAIPTEALARSAVATVAYDPKVLEPVGGAAAGPGRVRVNIAGSTVPGAQSSPSEVRFKVLPDAEGTTSLTVENASGVDADGNPISVGVPGGQTLTILPAR
jgi:general secretion pathway protein D